MTTRLKRLRRIETLQKQLHDLARWRLVALGRRRDELAETHGEMLDALGEGLMAYGGPAAAGNRRIRALEVEIAGARLDHAAQAEEALRHGARSKLADRAAETAEVHHRRELEKKSLAELIEWSLQAAVSGPRKA